MVATLFVINFLIESLKPGLCVLFYFFFVSPKCSLKYPFGCGCFFFGVRRLWECCMFGDGAGVKTPRSKKKKGRLKETVAAPVVPCGCCAAGLAPAHTAAVWLSVWAAGITGRPFTPAQTAVCSPSPSALVHSASSIISSSASLHRGEDFYLPHFILCTPNLSVCLCSHLSPPFPSSSSFNFMLFLSPAISLSLFFFCLSAHSETQTAAAGSRYSPSVELDSF